MLNQIDSFYLEHEEPTKGCLLALRAIILSHNEYITQEWKYHMPFFYFKGRMLIYLRIHKKYKMPYLGVVDGFLIDNDDLLAENRSRMRILLVNDKTDINMQQIKKLLTQAIALRS